MPNPMIIEVNISTGEQVEREMTLEEIASLPQPEPPAIPNVISRAQAKIWLYRAGKLASIEASIAESSDEELKLWWAEASEFRRDNSYIVALADPAAFDIDLDVAFTEAAAIV